jgi:ketopantoate reductase
MNVLVVGAGVIGTAYGAQLAASGHMVAVLEHGTRTAEVARLGLVARDLAGAGVQEHSVSVVPDASGAAYDLVLVCVWAGQIQSATSVLRALTGTPVVLVFGNNTSGRSALDVDVGSTVHLGFPGIGGSIRDGAAEYVRIPQQPTTLEASAGPVVEEFAAAMSHQGFPVTRTLDMEGWLLYHAVLVASISAALYRCDGSAAGLAEARVTRVLMCRAIEEGFDALRREGVKGLPRNLRTLHLRPLRPFAVWYWARTLRSPMGERAFAAHARRAEQEMQTLAKEVIERLDGANDIDHLRHLLTAD